MWVAFGVQEQVYLYGVRHLFATVSNHSPPSPLRNPRAPVSLRACGTPSSFLTSRVLFGGSGCIPGILLLQCWIERAWADGYDPEGCEQLGGPGALMGSETWVGATECATLLRQAKRNEADTDLAVSRLSAEEIRHQTCVL